MEAGEGRQLSTLSGVPKVPPDRHDLRCTSRYAGHSMNGYKLCSLRIVA